MQKIDILDRLSDKSIQLLRGLNPDLSEIKQVKAGDVIFLISKESEEIAQVLRELKVSFKSKKKIDIADWIINAYSEAYVTDSRIVEVQHLLLSLLLGIDVQKYYHAKRKINLNIQTSRQGYLAKYVEDFTEIAKKSKTSILHGRSKELIHLMVNLSTKGGKPTLLIGGSGSGKTTLMKELARKIIENDVPEELIGSRILGIKLSGLVNSLPIENNTLQSGMLSSLFSSIAEMNKDQYTKTILFFDDLNYGVNFFVGIESAYLSNDILFVGAARDDNSEKFWESPISKMWNVVFLDDQSDKEIKEILINYGKKVRKKDSIEFSVDSIGKIVEINKADLANGDVMPGAGIKMMDLLATYKRHIMSNSLGVDFESDVITALDVDTFFNGQNFDSKDKSSTSKILNDRLETLEDSISKEIIGQDTAISLLVSSLRVSSLKLYSEPRPVGTFLFLGPTGVGKTQISKVLARQLFGYKEGTKKHPDKFLRIDMTEYSEKHSVSKLFGAPPGYIGYDDGASLCDFVSENPNSVVLFDEIDKAHPDVLNSLLHIMDEAEIRSNTGDMVSFEEVIILMTSNHGANLINSNEIGFSNGKNTHWKSDLKTYLKKHLKPEFLNRFDEIIIFEPLNEDSLLKITDSIVNPIIKSLSVRNIMLKVSLPVKRYLVKKSGTEYGARELRRAINRDLIDPISKILLKSKDVLEIRVSYKNGNLLFDS